MKSLFLIVLLCLGAASSLHAQDVQCEKEKYESTLALSDALSLKTKESEDAAKSAKATEKDCLGNPALYEHKCAEIVTEDPCWSNINPGVYNLSRTEGDLSLSLSASHDEDGAVAVFLLDTNRCRYSDGDSTLGNIGTYFINGRKMDFFGACVNQIAMERPISSEDQEFMIQEMLNREHLTIETPNQGEVEFDVREFPHISNLLMRER